MFDKYTISRRFENTYEAGNMLAHCQDFTKHYRKALDNLLRDKSKGACLANLRKMRGSLDGMIKALEHELKKTDIKIETIENQKND